MSSLGTALERNEVSSAAINSAVPCATSWYAVQTKARHEKVVADRFREQGMTSYLPLVSQVRRWSDRKKVVALPLFSCYVFVRLHSTVEDRVRACSVSGVFHVLSGPEAGISIPDAEIEAVRLLTEQQFPWVEHPFLKIGQRVRVRSGALNGVEGILLARNGDRTLVVSVNVIQRSLAVKIENYDVEPL